MRFESRTYTNSSRNLCAWAVVVNSCIASQNSSSARINIFDRQVKSSRPLLQFRHRCYKLQTRPPIYLCQRQRTSETAPSRPEDHEDQDNQLGANWQYRSSSEVTCNMILSNSFTLMILIKSD